MNLEQTRQILSQPSFTPDQAFEVVREVGIAWQDSRVATADSLDLIVRAVAIRDALNEAAPGLDQAIGELARQAGLYPYLDNASRWTTLLIRDLMKAPGLPEFTFHLEQMQVFTLLYNGASVILSAPTSFGKSLLVDALISVRQPNQVIIVVPTLALLDEYRRRLRQRFANYNIVAQDYQRPVGERDIFVGTQEWISAREIEGVVDLFIVDEFYKLDLDRSDDRAMALNAVLAEYAPRSKQIYLLGPSIDSVSSNTELPRNIRFYKTSFTPVATDIIDHSDYGPDPEKLAEVLAEIDYEPTLIYVRSPQSAAKVAFALFDSLEERSDTELSNLSDWLGNEFHPEWVAAKSVRHGLGIHHGRVPRSIGQLFIRLFNQGSLPYLICTSSLIEGVNTVAKNVIIFDKFISRKKLDRFTFDNIKGRAGRMFQHFVGRVILFNPAPVESDFDVEIPLFSGFENVSDEMVMHVSPDVLGQRARRQRDEILKTSILPAEFLKRWSRFGIEGLNTVAQQVQVDLATSVSDLIWSGYGHYGELVASLSVVWNDWTFEKHGMLSPEQAAYFATSLRDAPTIRAYFDRFVRTKGLSAQADIDKCFNFLRGAEYTFPEVLRALEELISTVTPYVADYSYFARELQNWFLPGNLRVLDEFGIPAPIIRKVQSAVPQDDPDEALRAIRQMAESGTSVLSEVERQIVRESFG